MASTSKIIKSQVAEAALLVEERYGRFFEDPDDPETNHKLRVSIRTLRSLVNFLEPWQRAKQSKRIQKNLKLVVRETSRLRELDVLEQIVTDNGNASEELLAFCKNEAASERKKTLETLSSPDMATMLWTATEEAQGIRWKKSLGKRGVRAKDVRKRYKKMVKSLLAELDDLDLNDYERVHELRKRVKQARYVSENFPDIVGKEASSVAGRMKEEQDRLGDVCDAHVNEDLASLFASRDDVPPELVDELSRLLTTN